MRYALRKQHSGTASGSSRIPILASVSHVESARRVDRHMRFSQHLRITGTMIFGRPLRPRTSRRRGHTIQAGIDRASQTEINLFSGLTKCGEMRRRLYRPPTPRPVNLLQRDRFAAIPVRTGGASSGTKIETARVLRAMQERQFFEAGRVRRSSAGGLPRRSNAQRRRTPNGAGQRRWQISASTDGSRKSKTCCSRDSGPSRGRVS